MSMSMSFKIRTEDEIFSYVYTLLKKGLMGLEESNYRTENRNLALIVSPKYHYFELYSYGRLLFRMDFLVDNTTWDESFLQNKINVKTLQHYTVLLDIHNQVKEERGIYVL